jgi:hypothetical protein
LTSQGALGVMTKKRTSKIEKQDEPKIEQPDVQIIVHKYPSFVEWFVDGLSQFKDWATNLSLRKSTLTISFITLILAVLFYYPSRTEDYDIWYHLKFGEHFVKNLTFKLDHSMFSWTPADPNWRYGIWLGSSVLYMAYKMFSVYGFYIVQWLIFAAIILLYWKFIKVIGDSLDINHIASLMLVFIALNLTAIYIKPELFTTLFFTIAVFIYFYTKFTSKNLFFIYPLLLFIWVNTHGGYLIGLIFISIVLVGEVFNYFFLKRNQLTGQLFKYLLISVLASYFAVMFNPYGVDYHIGIIKSLITKEYMSYATQVYAWIDMWRYLFPKAEFAFRFVDTAWALVIMVTSFFSLSIYLYAKKRFFDITLILLNAVFFYLGMKNARVTLFLPLIWMFSILYILKKADALNIKMKFAPIALMVFFVMALYISDLTIINLEDRSWFGSNLEAYAPIKEVEFVKNNKLPGPIFNDYLIGGYLIWAMYPDYKVFIDPRYGPYWKEVGPDYFELIGNMNVENLKKFTSKYPFKIALLHMREHNLIFLFLSLPEWKLLYFYKTAVVITHQSVIPSLSQKALSTDMSPDRFRDVTNPMILDNLFNFYINVGPAYAREILDIYKNNVSVFFRFKAFKIQEMENIIKQVETKR